MHELGIVFHIIRGVEEVGRKNRVKRVSAVTLQLGEVSGVVEHYLQDCWRWAAPGPCTFRSVWETVAVTSVSGV